MSANGSDALSAPSSYRPQLDGLRAFAIVFVLIQHGFPESYFVNRLAPWGVAGVRLFFVLSSFLITRILLECRDRSDRDPGERGHLARTFYSRRALRILPAYFVTLGVMYAVDAPGVRDAWIWLATFTSNLYFAQLGAWPGFVNHLWTLAVEEQFYLFWPVAMAFVPRRMLVPVLLATILSAPLWRAISTSMGHNIITTSVFTVSLFDSLGMGALLAIARDPNSGSPELLARMRLFAGPVGIPLAAFCAGLHATGSLPTLHLVLQDFAFAMAFTALVDRVCDGFEGRVGRFLEWGPVCYVGKISYGLYLYHRFLRGFLYLAVVEGYLPPPQDHFTRFLRIVAGSFVIAIASWHLFEQPINSLKRRFTYERGAERAGVDKRSRSRRTRGVHRPAGGLPGAVAPRKKRTGPKEPSDLDQAS